MPLIHGKEVDYGSIVFFTPEEIINSWVSCDGGLSPRQSCRWCVDHGNFECSMCWVKCTCKVNCNFHEDWEDVIERKRSDYQFSGLVKTLREEGFRIPLSVGWSHCEITPEHGDGHHRFCAAMELGLKRIPYSVDPKWQSSSISLATFYQTKILNEPIRIEELV